MFNAAALGLTTRAVKGAPLTHQEMDENLVAPAIIFAMYNALSSNTPSDFAAVAKGIASGEFVFSENPQPVVIGGYKYWFYSSIKPFFSVANKDHWISVLSMETMGYCETNSTETDGTDMIMLVMDDRFGIEFINDVDAGDSNFSAACVSPVHNYIVQAPVYSNVEISGAPEHHPLVPTIYDLDGDFWNAISLSSSPDYFHMFTSVSIKSTDASETVVFALPENSPLTTYVDEDGRAVLQWVGIEGEENPNVTVGIKINGVLVAEAVNVSTVQGAS